MTPPVTWMTMRRIGLDTAPLIYYVENHAIYAPLLDRLIQRLDDGALHAIVSVLALTEILSKPLQDGDQRLVHLYRTLLTTTTGLLLQDVTPAIAERAAHLRATDGLKTPDALHVATAVETGCDAFVTNDRRLARSSSIPIVLLDDLIDL